MEDLIALALAFIAIAALTYLAICGLSWLVCFAFGLEWSWGIALGIWAACLILRWVLSSARGRDA